MANDDAEEVVSSGAVNLGSSDLELVTDEGDLQIVGVRFTNVAVPRGAVIRRAWLQFTTDSTPSSEATSVQLAGEATDHAAAFTTTRWNVSDRTRTTNAVTWAAIVPWTTSGVAGPDQQTPDLAPVIREIVGRPGWNPGNALAILVTGSGRRVAVSYNGTAGQAALLHVEY